MAGISLLGAARASRLHRKHQLEQIDLPVGVALGACSHQHCNTCRIDWHFRPANHVIGDTP